MDNKTTQQEEVNRVPVCFIFGVFFVDPLMQHQVFDKMK